MQVTGAQQVETGAQQLLLMATGGGPPQLGQPPVGYHWALAVAAWVSSHSAPHERATRDMFLDMCTFQKSS